jgi:hypothetical protein
MAVFATELVCGKCRNDMAAAKFEKEESSNHFTQSNYELFMTIVFKSELLRIAKQQ